ncbi:hypothetical protein [Microbispora hainanensis]|uniref:Uncharacterized protein n=1 Tax=Microbispora hainanensis TaxID=568844 RepID=A0A544Z3Q0_9ACTN|nr:hypothetical protein [Microbispora hainanensis]TQS23680.1 hypothetical protein FLX08_04350 [Microbispora hainanensis]
MRPEVATAFLESPEWQAIPTDLRERIYEADARLEEFERRKQVSSRKDCDETRAPQTSASQDPAPGKASGACAGCGHPIQRAATGRPARYCSQACRQRAYRARQAPTAAPRASAPPPAAAVPSTAVTAPHSPAHRLAEQLATAARHAADAITAGADPARHIGQARQAFAELAALHATHAGGAAETPPAPTTTRQPDEIRVRKAWSDRDPLERCRWYTDDELAAVQLVTTGDVDGSYAVIVAGDLFGTVRPHLGATGRTSGWEARHRGGTTAFHTGSGKRPATRAAAVTDLLVDVHHLWQERRRRRR